jgi:adenosine deaminase
MLLLSLQETGMVTEMHLHLKNTLRQKAVGETAGSKNRIKGQSFLAGLQGRKITALQG